MSVLPIKRQTASLTGVAKESTNEKNLGHLGVGGVCREFRAGNGHSGFKVYVQRIKVEYKP